MRQLWENIQRVRSAELCMGLSRHAALTMSSRLCGVLVLASSAFFVACGDGSDPDGDGYEPGDTEDGDDGDTAGDNGTCTAGVNPVNLEYVLDGSELTLTDAAGISTTLTRQGGGTDVYGTFYLGESVNGDTGSRGYLTLSPGRFKSTYECWAKDGATATAEAESAAEYTESSIRILEYASTVVPF
jgi:hypothetical protein